MFDELKDFKKLTSVSGMQDSHYDILCKIITDKIADTDLATRTKEQVAAHDKHVNSLNVKPPREKGRKGKGGFYRLQRDGGKRTKQAIDLQIHQAHPNLRGPCSLAQPNLRRLPTRDACSAT